MYRWPAFFTASIVISYIYISILTLFTSVIRAFLQNRIKNAIDKLGGEVFIKLNWSAPRDASWILYDGSLCCRAPLDVLLLLKGIVLIIINGIFRWYALHL